MILPQQFLGVQRFHPNNPNNPNNPGVAVQHGQVDPVALYSNSHSHLSAAEEAMDLPPKLRKVVLSACQARWDEQFGDESVFPNANSLAPVEQWNIF